MTVGLTRVRVSALIALPVDIWTFLLQLRDATDYFSDTWANLWLHCRISKRALCELLHMHTVVFWWSCASFICETRLSLTLEQRIPFGHKILFTKFTSSLETTVKFNKSFLHISVILEAATYMCGVCLGETVNDALTLKMRRARSISAQTAGRALAWSRFPANESLQVVTFPIVAQAFKSF